MTSERSSDPRQPGQIVAGKYRIDRVLGEGGMGVVVAATHEQLDQKVALKFLLPAVAAQPDFVRRFLREARAAVKVQSEHVARVLDVGTHDGAPYMVMEYLEGGDVSQVLLERGALPVQEAIGYLLEACEAIAEAHSLGIIHRDLKPANLFLAARPSGKPTIKVLDFGISKAPATKHDAEVTHTSTVMGSPSYMSPEQMMSATSVDARADIWALGVVLFEMVAHQLPFVGESMPQLAMAILHQPPQPLNAHRADLPAGLQPIIERCLQKEPAHRYGNVAELARALLPFGPPRSEQSVERIEHLLGQAAPAPAAQSLPDPRPRGAVAVGGATLAPITAPPSAPRSRALLIVLPLAAFAVVGLAGVLFFAWRSPAKPLAMPAPPALVLASAPPPSALALPAVPPAPSASDSPSAAPSATAPAPSAVTTRGPRTRPSAATQPSAAPSASAPVCRTTSYFDEDGNKHFKQVCQ